MTVELDLVVADPATQAAMAERAARSDAAGPMQEAITRFEAGDFAGAASLAEGVIADHPDLPQAHYLRGFALYRAGDVAAAEPSLRRAFELDPTIPDLEGLLGTVILQRAGEMAEGEAQTALYGEAADRLAAAIAAAGAQADPALIANWSVALLRSGRSAEAIAALEQLVAREPENVGALLRLAELKIESGDLEAGLGVLERVPAGDARAGDAFYNAAVPPYNAKEFDRALEIIGRGLARVPGHALLHRMKGRILLATERYEEALTELRTALKANPEHPFAQEDRALVADLEKQLSGG
jgi:tetratricopeptide (TPR) repeat protein